MKLKGKTLATLCMVSSVSFLISCSSQKSSLDTNAGDSTKDLATQDTKIEEDDSTSEEVTTDSINSDTTEEDTSQETDWMDQDWDSIYTVSDYTPNPDRMDDLELSSDLDKYELEDYGEEQTVSSDYEAEYEAEEGVLTGNMVVKSSTQGYSGSGYVDGLEGDGDTVTFQIDVPESVMYDLDVITCGTSGYKENVLSIDGTNVGTIITQEGTTFSDSVLSGNYIEEGEHEVTISSSWGWILIDKLVITPTQGKTEKSELTNNLIDPYATEYTKKLMQFLVDINGDYILSGQYADAGADSAEFSLIQEATGRTPAILGLDMIEYSPSRTENGSTSTAVSRAKKFAKEGGIITMTWHWNAPSEYLYDTDEEPWWKGFYTEGTNINLAKIMNGEDEEGYEALLNDMDVIAFYLKQLQDEKIPILWRPLHEASGGWFWWGASGSDAYKELWKLMYERLTYYHGLHNLIWVWNGQDADWYPGDEYVDIIGEDLYPGEKVYSSQSSTYNEAYDYTATNKIIAETECGCLFDPDLAFRDGSVWSWFATWSGDFVTKDGELSEQYTETSMFDKVYNHSRVITLDELPELSTYGD